MAKFKSKNAVIVLPKDDKEDFDPELRPRLNTNAFFINEHIVGPVYDVFSRKAFKQKELSAFQLWEEIRKHGVSLNPVTRLPRIIGLLLKLEEMGLEGDIDAIKLYLDRVAGKQPDNISLNLTKYEALSDTDLLDMVHSDGRQKSVQPQQPSIMATPSQEEENIEG